MPDDQYGKHGCCFDEGMSGRCGFECRCFLVGECEIEDEMIEEAKKEFEENLGPLRLAVVNAQTKRDPELILEDEFARFMLDKYGYDI